MKRKLLKEFAVLTVLLVPFIGNSQGFTEGFDDINTLAGSGWHIQNNSGGFFGDPGLDWFQGNPAAFPAFSGAQDSYIGANYNSVITFFIGETISNWLITPDITMENGDVLTFYTRTSGTVQWADRLEVRLSTSGTSTDVGTTETSVGVFTTLLETINPNLTLVDYPNTWTQYTITISGLSGPTSGRIAFRYFVTDAGLDGTNSDYIGIDDVVYTKACPSVTMTPGGALSEGVAGTAYDQILTQTGLSTPTFSVTADSLPSGLILASDGSISGTPTATGVYNFTVTVSDGSGCSESEDYSIEIVCPANPITFSAFPSLCSDHPSYTLTEASPSGGTYSGTGVSADQMDPSSGTQTIIYDYTDAYGCAHTDSITVTVNTPPTVNAGPDQTVCDYHSPVVLTQGTPSGGTYSGTGVSGGNFDPSVAGTGTHIITYTVTENGCDGTDQATIEVDACLGIESENVGLLSIFPNPATSELNVMFENTEAVDITVVLVTIDGKIVYQTSAKAMSVFNEKINVTDFADGIYFIRIDSRTNLLIQKVILN